MKKTTQISLAGAIIVLGGVYLFVRSAQRKKLFKEISDKIGPGTSGSPDQFDEWWNPDYCTNNKCHPEGKTVLGVSDRKLNIWADSLYNAAGYFNDDEGAFYGTLREIPDGVALSLTSGKFQRKYNEDLKEWLNYYLDDKDEQQKIVEILRQKPPFRTSSVQ